MRAWISAIRDWLDGRDLLIANGDVWWAGDVDLRRFVDEWDRERPRLIVVADADRPDFEGKWRFAGLSLLPAAIAGRLQPVPSGLYEQVWSKTAVDLVPSDITFIDCGTAEDLALARSLA